MVSDAHTGGEAGETASLEERCEEIVSGRQRWRGGASLDCREQAEREARLGVLRSTGNEDTVRTERAAFVLQLLLHPGV